MICPLIEGGYRAYSGKKEPEDTECLEQECAWWDKVTARCHLVTISVDIAVIATHLCAMVDKMPPKKEY